MKMKKLISSVLALAIACGFAVISQGATTVTTTTEFEEYFNEWENALKATATAKGWVGGHNGDMAKIVADSEGDNSIGMRGGVNLTKTFDTPYEGIVNMTFNTAYGTYKNSTGADAKVQANLYLYVELADGTDETITVLMQDTDKRLEAGTLGGRTWLSNVTLADENDVELVVNTYEQTIEVTINGTTYKSTRTDSTKSVKSVTGFMIMAMGDGINYVYDDATSAWTATTDYAYMQCDDFVVNVSIIEEIPEETSSTLKFKDNFNEWENALKATATAKGWVGGHNGDMAKIVADSEGDNSIGMRGGVNLTKTFDTPYEGLYAMTFNTAYGTYKNSTGADAKVQANLYLYVKLADGTDETITVLMQDTDKRLEAGTLGGRTWLLNVTLADENDVELVVNTYEQTIEVTINGTTYKSTRTDSTKSVKSVTGFMIMAMGDGINYVYDDATSAWTATTDYAYMQLDDVYVHSKTLAETPAMTYLNMDFTYDETDYFLKDDIYSIVNYNAGNTPSKNVTVASADDIIAQSIIKFENNALTVGKAYQAEGAESSTNYYTSVNLPDEINNELIELSFKAKKNPAVTEPGEIHVFDNKTGFYGLSTYLYSEDDLHRVVLNHINGDSAAYQNGYGYAIKAQWITVPDAEMQNYRLLINNKDNMFSLYINDEFRGCFNFNYWYNQNESDASIFLKLYFANVVIDDIVVKDAPLLTQYYYKGVRGETPEDMTEEECPTETENANGHFPKTVINDFFYAENFGTVVKVANTTGLDKTAMIVNAVYDANGKLISVAASEEKALNKLADDGTGTAITEFSVTHTDRLPENLTDYTSKTIVLESVSSLTPLYEAIVLD